MSIRSRKSELFINALLSCRTIEEAATKAGIALITGRRWLHDPNFAKQFREARHAIVRQAVAQLQTATAESIAALREIVSGGASETARVAA